jgi:hypothetical protein
MLHYLISINSLYKILCSSSIFFKKFSSLDLDHFINNTIFFYCNIVYQKFGNMTYITSLQTILSLRVGHKIIMNACKCVPTFIGFQSIIHILFINFTTENCCECILVFRVIGRAFVPTLSITVTVFRGSLTVCQ